MIPVPAWAAAYDSGSLVNHYGEMAVYLGMPEGAGWGSNEDNYGEALDRFNPDAAEFLLEDVDAYAREQFLVMMAMMEDQ